MLEIPRFGEVLSVTTAFVWSLAVILFKKSGERVHPIALNMFKDVLALVLFVPTIYLTGGTLFRSAPAADYGWLLLSGVLGIGLGDTLFFASLNRLGAGLTAIVDATYSPFIVLFAFGLLGERLSALQLLGMLLVITAVVLASYHHPRAHLPRRALLAGIAYGLLAMSTVALAIVIAKPALTESPVIWATTVRQVATLAVMLPAALLHPQRRRLLGVFRPAPNWRFSLPGTLLGSCLALLLWIAGMKYTQVGAAAILNQTSTIFVLILATLFLRERFTGVKLAAALLAVAGIVLVTQG
jgi:drug/metabolite transporter (DMT)-like permease